MAIRAPKVCAYGGCGRKTTGRYCTEHQAKHNKIKEAGRKTSAQRGYGRRWQRVRLNHLKANPLCVECDKQGKTTPATEVDHIIPHKGDQALFWDTESNLQSLCKHHHSAKTVREDGGFGQW